MEFEELRKISGAYWHSRAILSAIELDIFTKIHGGINSISELSKECNCSIRGLKPLIIFLVSIGLLEEKDGGFEVTKDGLILSSKYPQNKLGYFYHQLNLWESWKNLTKAIKTGKPTRKKFDYESFILAMEQGKEISQEIFKNLPLEDNSKILDLGGGPGVYSIALLKFLPKSVVYLFDLPEVIEFCKKRLPEEILKEKRLNLIKGDFLKNPIGYDYDLIWASSIIHSLGDRELEKLFKKCAKALKKGGKIFILDFFLNDDFGGPTFSALFSLNMLVNTKNGKTYSFKEIEDLLSKYGFVDFKRLPFFKDTSILVGKLE